MEEKRLIKYGKERVYVNVICDYCHNFFFKRKSFITKNNKNFCTQFCSKKGRYLSDPNAAEKLCSYCEEHKPNTTEYFYKKRNTLSSLCKQCTIKKYKKQRKAYRDNNKDYLDAKNKSWRLKTKYGVTLEEIENLKKEQNNKCAICGMAETKKFKGRLMELSIDHCHDTGKFRGLICNSCNVGLGRFKDNIEILRKAVQYLEKTK